MLHFIPLLAQAADKTNSWSWAIVLFCLILGLLVSLNPSRRSYEFKRDKEE